MALLAQLSDAHLVELDASERDAGDWVRLAFLSSYRPSRAVSRVRKLAGAFARARAAGADHVVFTGDLTEDAAPGQFALFAHIVAESGFTPEQVTVIPGNHDAYRGRDFYAHMAAGTLGAVARTSSDPFDLDGVRVVPLDSTLDQHYVRAAGCLGAAQRAQLRSGEGPTLVLQHHPPLAHAPRALSWFQELVDLADVQSAVAAAEHLYVMHGHVHRDRDLYPYGATRPRVFSPRAVVETDAAVRFYEVDARGVRPLGERLD
ncbi:MAG: metallophosphoesterase [Polyangiales bacterium]|nr:metallophosphoesterase family protein [Sandaracinaceae bacterium]